MYVFPVHQPLAGQDFLIIEASRSHSVTQTTFARIPLDERSAQPRVFSPT